MPPLELDNNQQYVFRLPSSKRLIERLHKGDWRWMPALRGRWVLVQTTPPLIRGLCSVHGIYGVHNAYFCNLQPNLENQLVCGRVGSKRR